jgi:hypothetical protein
MQLWIYNCQNLLLYFAMVYPGTAVDTPPMAVESWKASQIRRALMGGQGDPPMSLFP